MDMITPVLAFEDNYIWLIRSADGKYAAIVDPGDAEPVIEALRTLKCKPIAILITHHHYDHTGGIGGLLACYPMPVYGPAREDIPHFTHGLSEGDEVFLPELDARFAVLEVFGHTAGHIAYYGQESLFCGDALFTGGCGRLFEGTAEQMHASLTKISVLPESTQIYCAHEYTQANLKFAKTVEPENADLEARISDVRAARQQGRPTVPASLELEKRTNPFLRSHDPVVAAAAERFAGRALSSDPEVFATVRHWKDSLD
ncbi:MAG: hydroxyacylglutathione hydrolase [Gammaproteobacteria bacterium]|nr:hydroxyacylglutathione hydrolase [Gammaproteobacteria bacterium]